MILSDRQQYILAAVIEQFIRSVEPVASRALIHRYALKWSSATVRSELNELERLGYLTHLHTSSGRLPTDKGYRYYVDRLMNLEDVEEFKLRLMAHQFETACLTLSDILEDMSAYVSSLLNYATFMIVPDVVQESFDAVHLVVMDVNRILVVLLNPMGVNREFMLRLDNQLTQDQLNRLSAYLTQKFGGSSVKELAQINSQDVHEALPDLGHLASTICQEIGRFAMRSGVKKRVMSGGVSKMLTLPEFQDVQLARNVVQAFEDHRAMCDMLMTAVSQRQGDVFIGSETQLAELSQCSLVVSPYMSASTPVGVIGVLGPKRMAYSQVVPMVRYVSRVISDQYL